MIENATGGSANDNIGGNAVANILIGNGGSDVMLGRGGADQMNGGAGNDFLTGGGGGDKMTGGAGADTFIFTLLTDSFGRKDRITDFAAGLDDIRLTLIDAIVGTAVNDAFTFVGTAAFGTTAGHLRYQQDQARNVTLVEAEVNGDGNADFSLTLVGLKTLTAADFLL